MRKFQLAIVCGLLAIVAFSVSGSFKSPTIWRSLTDSQREIYFWCSTPIGAALFVVGLGLYIWWIVDTRRKASKKEFVEPIGGNDDEWQNHFFPDRHP